jgi:hypothetical protein
VGLDAKFAHVTFHRPTARRLLGATRAAAATGGLRQADE